MVGQPVALQRTVQGFLGCKGWGLMFSASISRAGGNMVSESWGSISKARRPSRARSAATNPIHAEWDASTSAAAERTDDASG